MNRILLSILFLFAFSACKQNARTVLVAGDSWGFFVCTYKSLDKALQTAGIQDTGSNSTCAVTTRVGMRASNWLESAHDKSTQVALTDPSVKVLFLSLGGNDLMNEWNKNMSPAQEEVLFSDIRNRVARILERYKKSRPDIKIIVSGYDFPHFSANHPVPEYREAYQSMGSPTPVELNSALIRFSQVMASLRDENQIAFIHHIGLMHYYYGNSETGLTAKTTLAPEFISSPEHPEQVGGDLHHQTDVLGMLSSSSTGIVDAFHLSKRGYEKLADHVVSLYLKSWLSTP